MNLRNHPHLPCSRRCRYNLHPMLFRSDGRLGEVRLAVRIESHLRLPNLIHLLFEIPQVRGREVGDGFLRGAGEPTTHAQVDQTLQVFTLQVARKLEIIGLRAVKAPSLAFSSSTTRPNECLPGFPAA